MSDAELELERWFDENNPGGHDFSKPPPREMLERAFPKLDDAEIDYLIRKPNRAFERFD